MEFVMFIGLKAEHKNFSSYKNFVGDSLLGPFSLLFSSVSDLKKKL